MASGSVDRVFVPALIELPAREGESRAHTCFFTQELPGMLRSLRDPRILTAQYSLEDGLLGGVESSMALAETLNRSPIAVSFALGKAWRCQQRFAEDRERLGRLALSSEFDRAVVVLGRPYNLFDPMLNLSLAKHLERLGLAAIPCDLLPLSDVRIPRRWRTLPWHYSREQIRSVQWMRHDPLLFGLMVSNFGCGPDAFTAKHLQELLGARPHLVLEFDEHRGEAGLATRLEAFADEIDSFCRRRKPAHRAPTVTPGPRAVPAGRRFFVPNISEHARMYAATLRAAGFEASVLPAAGEAAALLGEQHCSGRECHPYVLLAGDLLRFLEGGAQPGDVFLVPNCAAPCLVRQYGDAMRILLARRGARYPEIWESAGEDLLRLVGTQGLARLYEGLLGTDLLMTAAIRLRPYEAHRGSMNRLLLLALEELENTLSARGDATAVLRRTAAGMWTNARIGGPGDRPVVGLTGDLFTPVNPAGNHRLVERLEAMGCEVWLSPSYAAGNDLATVLDASRAAGQGRLKDLALDGFCWVVTDHLRRRVQNALPAEVGALALEPPPSELIALARPYVGAATNYLIVLTVAKLVDFLQRGASAAISAAGVNCAIGSLAAAAIPAIRADNGGKPVISLLFGSAEGPADRIRLDAFVQQLKLRPRLAVA